jgi:hypothetical protein
MNTIRNIEGATFLTIGALCAAAVLSIAMQAAHAFPAHDAKVASVTQLPTVTIVGKRLTAAEKADMLSHHVTL